MADKVQNITINYKFNTAEIDRANASLNQANQASNRLQQSGAKAGQSISSGIKQGTQSILQMQNSLTRLKSLIEISTNPKTTARLSSEYKKLKVELDAATKSAFNLATAQKTTGQATGSLVQQFGGLYTAMRAIITAGIAREVVNIAINMAKLAGNTQGVERAFERAFPGAVDIMSRLRAATKGTITDFELMQRTLQATNLGVSVERLPELFEFAATRAQQTGESVDYLVDSIVRGIGRKSPLILDNLGISAIRLKEKFDGASLASQSIADVTEAVADITREEMEKMGGYVETGATKVGRLTTSWKELKTELSEKFDSSGVVSFLNEVVDGFRNMIRSSKDAREATAENAALIEFNSLKEANLSKDRIKTQQGLIDAVQQEINTRVELINIGNREYSELNDKFVKLRETHNVAHIKEMDSLKVTAKGIEFKNKTYEETIKLLQGYLAELTKVNDAEQGAGLLTIKKLQEQRDALTKQREEATFIGDTAELDRLQRLIMLKEDEILKVSDRIKWEKQWNVERQQSAINAETAAKNEEKLAAAIDKVNEKIGVSIGDAPEFKDSLDEIEASIREIADTVEMTTGQEFLIRLRLGFQGKGGDASEIQKFVNDEIRKIGIGTIDILADQVSSIVDMELASYHARLTNLQDFYAEQQILAGDNTRAKEQLRLREERETKKIREEIARKEKQVRRTQVIIDIAAGIAKAFATYPWPYSLIPAAFVAAQGASQLAIINRQPTNFAKGVIDLKGPGTATSDSIPANLSRGESVMTAWETRHAGDVLKDIRAKKLDNDKLRELKQGRQPVASPSMDTSGIIKAIKEQKHPDIVKASNLVYESKKYNDEYKKRVRSSSMGI